MAGRVMTNSIGATQNPAYSGMSAIYPNLSQTTGQASQNVLSQLRGQLSPGTLATIQNQAARLGVSGLGAPGSDMSNRNLLSMLGTTSETQQNLGLQNFLNTLKGYSGSIAPTTGEFTSRDIAAQAQAGESSRLADSLAEQARQFDIGTGQKDRQFDISSWLQNQQYYAGLGPQYMNALGSYLNFL